MLKIWWIALGFICLSPNDAHFKHVVNTQWDFLIFSQSWPETSCKTWMHDNPSHHCALPSQSDSWIVHGIWPTRSHTHEPEFCNSSWQFDPEQVKPIEDELEQFWTNIHKDTSKYSFWAHEWNKHGTCATSIDALNSELKYFSKGISWLKTYSMRSILKASSIVPSNNTLYDIVDIHNAVKKILGKNPVVECEFEDGKQFLFEIRVCFSKSLQVIDCDGAMSPNERQDDILSNCKASEGISYLQRQIQSKKTEGELHKFDSRLQWD